MKKLVGLVALFICAAPHALACEAPPPAVVNLNANKFYSDKQNSIVDPKLKAEHDKAVQPLEHYMNELAKLSDKYVGNPAEYKEQGVCGLTWISSWAGQGALLGAMTNEQSYYERKWMLAGISLVYAKVQPLASKDQRDSIEKWLQELADLTIEHSELKAAHRNNHYYWEGLAVGAVGAITKNDRDLQWAKKAFETGMNDVDENGALPREIARGQRALHYHLFSAAPLVFLSSILNEPSPKLKRLVDFIMQSTRDPSKIAKMAGAAQESEKDHGYAWLEIYLRQNPDAEIEKFVKPKRPLKYSKLGGDLTRANPLEHPSLKK